MPHINEEPLIKEEPITPQEKEPIIPQEKEEENLSVELPFQCQGCGVKLQTKDPKL